MIVIAFFLFLLQIYSYLLLARVLMTWIPNLDYGNPIVQFLLQATEPVLRPIREAMPSMGGMDFSPLIVFLVINFVSTFLQRAL
jgi:YggT family protein